MTTLENSKLIWLASGECADQYAEFFDTVCPLGEKTVVNISADSDYALFVNGAYAASGQYGDYEHYKIYDTVDITDLLCDGENRLDFTVYHCGVGTTSRYRPYAAGVIYEVISDGVVIARSDEHTKSRLSPTYASGRQIPVSTQLGFTFSYDATKKSNGGYAPSVAVEKNCEFFPRPIRKHALLEPRKMASVKKINDAHYVIDLGGETVGLPHIDFTSNLEQTLYVSWGEHIVDGSVRWQIGKRNFKYEYRATKGHNRFTEYMLRIGARYIEVEAEHPINLNCAGIMPQVYKRPRLFPIRSNPSLTQTRTPYGRPSTERQTLTAQARSATAGAPCPCIFTDGLA